MNRKNEGRKNVGKNAKMKIAIFSDVFYPASNGVVSYTLTIAKNLSLKGHKIFLFVPKSKGVDYKKLFDKSLNKNIKIYPYRGLKAFFYEDFKFTNVLSWHDIKLFKEIDPDIVYYQSPFTIGLKGILLAKIFKKPLLGVFHTRIAHKDYLSNLGAISRLSKRIPLEKISWKYLKYFYKRCDAVICPSDDIRKDLIKRKINENIIVIHNFVDKNDLKNSHSKIVINKCSFVYLGRLSIEKNIYCLLRGFRKVIAVRKHPHMYIIGDGPISENIKEFILKKGMNNNVHMLGRIDRAVILKTDLLCKFQAIVTMSNTEVQPLSLIEAMFKGLPILGPNTDGIRELISTNGILVKKNSEGDIAKAMLRIVDDPLLQKKLSTAAISKSKDYDAKLLINKLEKHFMELLNSNRKKHNLK